MSTNATEYSIGDLVRDEKTGKVLECIGVTKHISNVRYKRLGSINCKASIVSQEDLEVIYTLGPYFAIEIFGDTYQHLPISFHGEYMSIGDPEIYGIYIRLQLDFDESEKTGMEIYHVYWEKDPVKYPDDLTEPYDLKVFAEETEEEISYVWRDTDNLKKFMEIRGEAKNLFRTTMTDSDLHKAVTLLSDNLKNVTNMNSMFMNCHLLNSVPLFDTRNVTDMGNMFYSCIGLNYVPLFDTRNVTKMSYMFANCSILNSVPLFDTRNVTDMGNMFMNCRLLNSVPLFDTRNVTNMNGMFYYCYRLGYVPLFDTRNVTDMGNMFASCDWLKYVPLFDTRNVTNMNSMFMSCHLLNSVPLFDTRNVTNMSVMFYGCSRLTECYLRNIKTDLQVGSGSSWGHLLTVDSLIHLIRELRNTGSKKTLTMGLTNLAKLTDIYVKTIDITDEMRAEDDLIDEKLPFEICESTDEGATLITDYVLMKHWQLK